MLLCLCVCLMDRNGLGPSKEGEAQYSVVHCTGYIKAWPPAGKQTHTLIHILNSRHLSPSLLNPNVTSLHKSLPRVSVAWFNLKQLQALHSFGSGPGFNHRSTAACVVLVSLLGSCF